MDMLKSSCVPVLALMLLSFTAIASPSTINFNEFAVDSGRVSYSRGYQFTAEGDYTSGVEVHPVIGNHFRAYENEPACGGGCFAEASIEFGRFDTGPFALYGISTFGIEAGEVQGRSAVDGSWFTAADYPDYGQGPWLNITAVRYENSAEAVDTNAVVQLRADDVQVAEVLQAEIDFDPWRAANEARPNDAYFFTVGVKTLSVADSDGRDLDATTIDVSSVKFGPSHGPAAYSVHTDFDGDGDLDILLSFRMQESGISCLVVDTEVKLIATTTSGEVIGGKDTITKTGCTGTETLHFDEQQLGTSGSVLTQGFLVTGGSIVGNIGGDAADKAYETWRCESDYGGCYFYYDAVSLERPDGKPFALYASNGFGGQCSWIYGCQLRGYSMEPDSFTPNSEPMGTGGWLNLRKVIYSTESYDWQCEGCYLSMNNVAVGDALSIEIDFDPWNAVNEIRPRSEYMLTIGIATTNTADGDDFNFDAAQADPASLRVGPDAAEVAAAPLAKDFDGDGDIDYIFGFRMEDTGNTCGNPSISISGATYNGVPFGANDSVVPVDCEEPMLIDVEPYSATNRVYPDDSYLVQVGVKTTSVADGDPYDFNGAIHNSVRFGPGEAENNGYVSSDFDGDGDTDTIYTFQMQDTGIFCGDTEVVMTAERYTGEPLRIPLVGMDAIQTEDCVAGGCHP
jgi:hypothetical protein